MSDSSEDALPRLLARLDLEPRGELGFRGAAGRGGRRLFGGLVAAQAVIAAGRTVEDAELHSMHAYFLRAGREDEPIDWVVERTRDGRRFTSRRAVALQRERVIFQAALSFTRIRSGAAHGDEPPPLGAPEALEDWESVRARLGSMPRPFRQDAFDVRVLDPERDRPGVRSVPERSAWLKLRGAAPSDPLLRRALVVYASDRTLLRAAARAHGLVWNERPPASLDHAVWLHGEPALDDWFAFVCTSPRSFAARGLAFGAMYGRDGARFASVAQEGLLET